MHAFIGVGDATAANRFGYDVDSPHTLIVLLRDSQSPADAIQSAQDSGFSGVAFHSEGPVLDTSQALTRDGFRDAYDAAAKTGDALLVYSKRMPRLDIASFG
ncbi:MAG: hypothetical protein GWP91_06815 [Rhodobacterales bacterium]|nr:hypothetical protein [Rhodobacterales bacterium]